MSARAHAPATTRRAAVLERVPASTLEWLLDGENPAVAALTRRELLGEPDDTATATLWTRRNEYTPVAAILGAQLPDGAWTTPGQDYRKYGGSLWQVHFLGELHASGDDERVQHAAEYAFSRQLDDGSWSCSNGRPAGSITCLTANVGRALARMIGRDDPRVIAGLGYCADLFAELGEVNCRWAVGYQLNGYCHMVTPKLLLYLAEVGEENWPTGAAALRDACVARLREKAVFHSLPEESAEFQDILWSAPTGERDGLLEQFLEKHPTLHYKEKTGWKRFGYPLSYNSDALEALAALAAVGELFREEYRDALDLVRKAADREWRWPLRNTFNGKMIADVESKGQPSRWLTYRALGVLEHFGRSGYASVT